jgi:uncharacterized protein YcbK (DUF882 family)
MSAWNPETTPNFTRVEMACNCGCGECEMRQDFMDMLQALRRAYGKPLSITCGYRCPNHPDEASKANPGSHAQGRAADIRCTDAGMRDELLRRAYDCGMSGKGIAKGFIHLDNGHDFQARPAVWSY